MQKSSAKKRHAQVTTCMLLAHLTPAAFEREEPFGDSQAGISKDVGDIAKWESLKM